MWDKEIWKNRRSCRYFDTTKSVDPYDVDKVIEIMDYVPQQRGGIPANLWFVLGPDKQELKDYVFWNCAWHDDGYATTGVEDTAEHFMSIKTAPYLFLACRSEEIDKEALEEITLFDRNNGFMAGVMVTTIIHLGYNASQIACFQGLNKLGAEERQAFTEELWRHFDKSKLDPLIKMNQWEAERKTKGDLHYDGVLRPKLAIGMGYKNETMNGDDNEWAWIEGYENKNYFVYGRKKTLKHSGVIQ
tara:strand:- start:740 stop:1474 length:735 start_codon:yes stop_codon:yes gene_type:complete